jgi:hypothetical protein
LVTVIGIGRTSFDFTTLLSRDITLKTEMGRTVLGKCLGHVPKNRVESVRLSAKMIFKHLCCYDIFRIWGPQQWYFWRVNMSPRRLPMVKVSFGIGSSLISAAMARSQARRCAKHNTSHPVKIVPVVM